MPRPSSVPRRVPEPDDRGFPPFKPVPPIRVLSSVNVKREDKSLLDALQLWLSFREGRAVQQWELMQRLMEAALTNERSPAFREFRLPSPPQG